MKQPATIDSLVGQTNYRIIPSVLPPINFFEDLVDATEMQILWEIENLTNERIRQETGDIFLVSPEDRISGPGSSVIMAAFTHVYQPSRFTDGNYGVYYAGLTLTTAIRETVFHRERFFNSTNEEACEITMRCYESSVAKPLHDIRTNNFVNYHHPHDYTHSQTFARELRDTKSWGLVYKNVRHDGGECIAVFRPPAVTIPKQTSHFKYIWNGEKITAVYDTKLIMAF